MVELTARSLRLPAVRSALVRSLAYGGLALGLTASGSVGALGFENGGYFPVSWGWSGLALFALAALAIAAGVTVEIGRLELVLIGGLAALTGWVALSLLWTSSVTETVYEIQRTLVYLGGALAVALLLRRASVPMLIAAVWAGITAVCGYGLATRLFPDKLGTFDSIAGSRLSEPLGYWNGLGILAAMGALLALVLAARSGPLVRCLAAASTVVCLLTLYFTFSRGGWIAFFCGLAAAIALDRQRLQLITTTLVLVPWSVLAIWSASRSHALTHLDPALFSATRDGHGMAVIAIVLAVVAALAVLALDWLESALRIPDGIRRVYAGTLLFILAALVIVVFGRYGFPPTLARKAYDAFTTTVPNQGADLNKRLFSLSGNGRTEQFHTAWGQVGDHPVLGGGAGSFAAYWFQHRRVPATVHDAHNLYLETLAELGIPGLLLLLVVLAVPLLALRRARSSPLAAAAVAAYVAYVLHAAIDWDWEMPTITLSAVFCGLALLALARSGAEPRALLPRVRWSALGGTVALGGFVLLGLLGNSAVSASSKATAAGHLAAAESDARRATHLAPWSSEPWRKLGEAQLVASHFAEARVSFRKAIAEDGSDWTLWFELATVSRGDERRRALAEASRLNPLDPRLRPQAAKNGQAESG
jgi:hypothetical protein